MRTIIPTALGLLFSLQACAGMMGKDRAELPPAMTAEQRENAAEAHVRMAECLRSNKTVDSCHSEMMQSCKQMKGSCPMMGPHGQHRGKATTGR